MRHLFFEVKQFLLLILRLIFVYIGGGYSCLVCGKKSFLIPLCPKCRKKYFSVDGILGVERCRICGRTLISSKNTCLECREKPLFSFCDRVLPLFSYRLWNKEVMFAWKSKSDRSLSAFFAGRIARVLKDFEKSEKSEKFGQSIIVPVPPRKNKIKANGWDQIDEICAFLERRWGFKVLKVLVRNTSKEQKKLKRQERLEQSKSAYSLCSSDRLSKLLKPFGELMPAEVWLVDDVCTTGSTVEACAEILKKGGVKTVNVITLFTVD